MPVQNPKVLPENIYLHALLSVEGIGARRLTKILQVYKTASTAYNSRPTDLKKLDFTDKIISSFTEQKNKLNLAEEYEHLNSEKIELVSIFDKDYPELLNKIYDPPPLLYLKGDRKLLNVPKVAIVGTRQCSPYALRITRKIIASLTNSKICTVSGLARGIDYCVHINSLEFDIPTVAVLGCGLRTFKGNGQKRQQCFDDIIKKGLVISEFAPDTPGRPHNFPLRNRVISGLVKNVIVIEAPEKSGALITAANALDQNRDVIAVPGPIDSVNSLGANSLINDGATILLKPEDLPQLLGCEMKPSVLISGTDLGKDSKSLLNLLSERPLTFDELICKTGFKTDKLNTFLSKLLLQNIICETSPQYYSLIN